MPVDTMQRRAVELATRAINARRARHYRAVFLDADGDPSVHAEKVLADLRRFCRVNASTFHADPRIHALLEGRREVALRILTFIGLDSAELDSFVEVIDE